MEYGKFMGTNLSRRAFIRGAAGTAISAGAMNLAVANAQNVQNKAAAPLSAKD